MIRTLEQRVRYGDSRRFRRLEFDGEIIPRGLVTLETGANDQYRFNDEFNVPHRLSRLRQPRRIRSRHQAPRRTPIAIDPSLLEARNHAPTHTTRGASSV